MKVKRILIFLLCAVMMATCVGCGTQSLADVVALYNDAGSDSAETTASSIFDYDSAYKTFDPDTVMATIDGYDVTWQELYYWLYNTMSYFEQNYSVTDWNTKSSEGITYGEYALKYAMNQIMKVDSILYNADKMGVVLGDEGEAYIQSLWDNEASKYDSEEAYIDQISKAYMTKDLYWKIWSADYLETACYNEMYGENGEKMSTDDVLSYFSDQGKNYYYIKQITVNITDENGVAYEGDTLTQYYDKIKSIKDQLDAYTGDDLNSYFTELMNEYSDDDRLSTYPNGYLFSEGIMDETVEETTKALAENQYSDIVQSSYAYHIILRLPVDPDMTPFTYSSTENTESLRHTASHAVFDDTVKSWLSDCEKSTTDKYDEIDFATMFPSK